MNPKKDQIDEVLRGDTSENQVDQDESMAPEKHESAESSFPSPAEEFFEISGLGNQEEILKQEFPQLTGLSPVQFDLDSIFPRRDGESCNNRRNRQIAGLLEKVAPLLVGRILQPDETVRKIAKGSAYFLFEIPYANGLLTLPSNHYALAATSHRLLFINLDWRRSQPTSTVFQVLYDEIDRVSRGVFLSSLIVKTRNGRNWNFTTVNRRLSREIVDFIRNSHAALPSGMYDGIPRPQLCPFCHVPLPDKLEKCPSCATVFKPRREATTRSLMLPGAGPIFLRYYAAGLGEMGGYLLAWLVAVAFVILEVPGGLFWGAALVLSYHACSALLAGKLAAKSYIPVTEGNLSNKQVNQGEPECHQGDESGNAPSPCPDP